jgi:hypothetical protein
MALLYLVPEWFFGYDIVLQILFGAITALVSFSAFRVYRLCEQRELKLLGYAFAAISMSYFVWPLLNLFVLSGGVESNVLGLGDLSGYAVLAVYAYVVLFLLGLSTLAYLTFNVMNDRLFVLIASLSIVGILFSTNFIVAFNFIAAVLLFYVALYYFGKYRRSRSPGVFLVFMAFVFLFAGRFLLFMSALSHTLYVADHILELTAYTLIMLSILKVMKKC